MFHIKLPDIGNGKQDYVREGEIVVCPCGGDNNHLESIKAGRDGKLDDDIIVIEFSCENNHAWTRKYQYHEGNTYLVDTLI